MVPVLHHFPNYMQVMPAVVNLMKEDAVLVTLIKPQFEARRSQVWNQCLSHFLMPFNYVSFNFYQL